METRHRADTTPAAAVEAAAALIELAVQESQAPVAALSGALGRMARSLGGTGDLPCSREQLAGELAVCIESLQFHDRLSQQLLQVRNVLASVAANGLPAGEAGHSANQAANAGARELVESHPADASDWEVLLENLRARFTSESHLILFNLLIPASGGGAGPTALHANEGSVELF